LNTSANRYTKPFSPASVLEMQRFPTHVESPETDFAAASLAASKTDDDDVPARRLLAHDMEHIVWEDDGERAAPPPD
jgi:hypothetical protein